MRSFINISLVIAEILERKENNYLTPNSEVTVYALKENNIYFYIIKTHNWKSCYLQELLKSIFLQS